MVSGHLQYFSALGVVLVLGDCAAVERQSLRTWTIIKLAPGCQFPFVAAHTPRGHPAHAWIWFWVGRYGDSVFPRVSAAKRSRTSTRATRTGPRNRPIAPKATTPPNKPRKTGRVAIWARPEMSRGRMKWSAAETTAAPQTAKKVAAPQRPCIASASAAGAQTRGGPTSGSRDTTPPRTPN